MIRGCCDSAYEYKVEEEYQGTPKDEIPPRALHKGLMASTTAHGLPHIYYARGWFKTVAWATITVVAVGWWLYNTYIIVREWTNADVNVNLKITTELSLEFPAVTICNQNPLRSSQVVANSDLANILDGSYFETATLPDYYDDYYYDEESLVDVSSRNTDLTRTEFLAENLATYERADLVKVGHLKDDLIQSCSLNGYACNTSQISFLYNWYYGNCYTINSGINVTTGLGGASTVNSTNTGPLYGLHLILNIEQDEYLAAYTAQAGVRVLIHDQKTVPFPEDNGLSVPVGLGTSIGITQKRVSRLAGRYGECVDSSKNQSNINMYEEYYPWSRYTQKACMNTCYQEYLIAQCRCADARYPDEGTALNRNETGDLDPCLSTSAANERCKTRVSNEYTNGTLDCQHCYRPCAETYYEFTSSLTVWPASRYVPTLQASLPNIKDITTNETTIAANLLDLEIYYKELNIETLKESPAYESGQFLSDLGGAIGLWVGASIITVFEYVEWILDSLVLACLKCRGKGKVRRTKTPVVPMESTIDFSKYSNPNSGLDNKPPPAVVLAE